MFVIKPEPRLFFNIYIVSTICFTTSCHNYSPKLKEALKLSGDNKKELLKVLHHFEEDSFKYAAANYLISNLSFQHNVISDKNTKLAEKYDKISENYPVSLRREKFIEGIKELEGYNNRNVNFHIQTLTSSYLIEYINSVCDLYLTQSWSKDAPFEIFAEYVLPYKLEDEKVEEWRSKVYCKYKDIINSINYEHGDVYEAENYSIQSESIEHRYTASNNNFVRLNEGDSLILKDITVDYNCLARLFISYFNGNDSTSYVLITIGDETQESRFLSSTSWSIKYHKRNKCDFNLKKGVYDIKFKVAKGSIGLDAFELKFNDYYSCCKTNFSNRVFQISNPFMNVGLSISKGTDNEILSVDSLYSHFNNFEFSGNDYGFFAIVNQDNLNRKNTLDLLNFQYEDYGKVILWDKINKSNQKWAFVHCGSSLYRIVNKFNGKCLTTDGDNVFLLRFDGRKGQLWSLDEQDDYNRSKLLTGCVNYERGDVYEFEKYSGDSLKIATDALASNGKYLLLSEGAHFTLRDIEVGYDCVGSFLLSFVNQDTSLVELSISTGQDTILSEINSNIRKEKFDFDQLKGTCDIKIEVLKGNIGLDVLELKFNDYLKNCSIDLKPDFEYEFYNPQNKVGLSISDKNYKYKELIVSTNPDEFGRFSFAEKELGFYKIVEKEPNCNKLVLDLLDFQYEDFGKIILWNNIGNLNQDWLFVHSGKNMFRIVNRYNGKCLTTDGEKVYLLRYNHSNNQLWSVTPKAQCNNINELIKPNSGIDLAARLSDEIRDFDFYDFPSQMYNPTVSELINYKAGSCIDEVRFVTSLNRTFGVPVTYDYVLQWPFRNDRHWWPVLINSEGRKIKYFMAQKPYENNYYDEYPKGKVFRKSYTANKDAFVFREKSAEDVPPLLRDAFYKDVTAEYGNVHDVKVPIKFNRDVSKKIGYVCVFDNTKWVPIWGGEAVSDTCFINKISERAMYLPVFYNRGSIESFYYPFHIEKNGKVDFKIPNKDSLINLTLKRKYPFIHWQARLSNNVQGGIFEASNDPSFKNADVLWKVDFYVDGQYYERNIHSNIKYKYFRYVGPKNSFCMINEIMLYDQNGNELQGKIIGTQGSFEDKGETLERVFDGNILTGFNAPFANNAWVGFEFKGKVDLSKIGFVPKNDGNIIEPGDEYELEYYDNGWFSCGRQKADKHQVTFKEVPSKALYILHNLTKGREERIFTYEKDKQVWW